MGDSLRYGPMKQDVDPEILAFLETLSAEPRVLFLLECCVGRVLERLRRRKANWREEASRHDIRHVVDWLAIAILHEEPWLGRVDERGRPRKLLKFPDLASVLKEANKAMVRRAESMPGIEIAEGDEELVFQLPDGWYVARLLTPAALDNESRHMQHCVGHGIYDEDVSKGLVLIHSLRDPFNKPHVTIEIVAKGRRVRQIRGKQNDRPAPKHARRVRGYLRSDPTLRVDSPQWVGLYFDADGRLHDVDSLPRGLSIRGDFDLGSTDIEELPEYLEVTGNLILTGSRIRRLPRGLRVWGSLRASRSGLEAIDAEHGIKGSIDVSSSAIRALPDGLEIDGDLDISFTAIERLPAGTLVIRDLLARGMRRLAIPSSCVIGRDIRIDDSEAVEFDRAPRQIAGLLTAARCRSVALPRHLATDGHLAIERSRIVGAGTVEVGGDLFCHRAEGLPKPARALGRIIRLRESRHRDLWSR